jgi:hypothetical protein
MKLLKEVSVGERKGGGGGVKELVNKVLNPAPGYWQSPF